MIIATTDRSNDRMASRKIGKGDDAYTETLKQFTGIPADICREMKAVIRQRKAQAGRKIKIGDVYGEALNGYMDAVESGAEIPDIKAQVQGEDAASVGVWIRQGTVERFETFVAGLGKGGESEVLAAALRWFVARE